MSEKKSSENQPAKKICDMNLNLELNELKLLVKNSAYVCRDCGRTAASDRNLCEPERL